MLGRAVGARRRALGVLVTCGVAALAAVPVGSGVASAVGADPAVVAWGANDAGQLGTGAGGTGLDVPVAVDVSGVLAGKTVTAISAGYSHTCVVAGGAPYCWGNNASGQLGDGNGPTGSDVPVAVDVSGVLAGKTVTAISVGRHHTCVVAGGAPYCWGNNASGQLGDGNGPTGSDVPVAVDVSGVLAGKTVTAIGAGYWHTCVVAGGAPYCWGNNVYRQLGDGNGPTGSDVPVAVDVSGVLAGKTVTAIDAGDWHTCVAAGGASFCWGANADGELGTGNTPNYSDVPVAVDVSGVLAGKTVTATSAGGHHSCVVAGGAPFCWGNNGWRQLGDGSTGAYSDVPVAVDVSGVLAGKTVTATSAGLWHSCVVAGGAPFCWGRNGSGQLGDGSAGAYSGVPVAVDVSGVLAGRTVTAISAGGYHSCVVAGGAPFCWGANGYGQLGDGNTGTTSGVPVGVDVSGVLAGKTVTAVSAGLYHSCVVAAGGPYCWGDDRSGQLGDGNGPTGSDVPVAVDVSGVLAGRTVTAISAGYWHTCVVAGGAPYCWGDNGYGQLGDGNTGTNSDVPVAVDVSGVLAGKTVTAISAGGHHSCVVADGAPYCWGYNFYGQLGDGDGPADSDVPVAVDVSGVLAGKTVTAISAFGPVTCVVASGGPFCWGFNDSGELGDGNGPTDSDVPVAVDVSGVLAGKTVTAISAAGGHSCVVAGGAPYCWGDNSSGELGDGSSGTGSDVPVAVDVSGVLAGKTVTAISGGFYHTCVVAGGAPYCWGDNASGQLGDDNSPTDADVPVAVDGSGVLAGTTVSAIDAGAFHVLALADTGIPPTGGPTSTVITDDVPDPSAVTMAYQVQGTVTVDGGTSSTAAATAANLAGKVVVSGDDATGCADTSLTPTGELDTYGFTCLVVAGPAPRRVNLTAQYVPDAGSDLSGSTSDPVTHTLVAMPRAPSGIHASTPPPGSRATVITVANLPPGPLTPTGYQIRCIPVGLSFRTEPGNPLARWTGTSTFPATVDGLTRGRAYHCMVRARYGPDYAGEAGDAYEGPLSKWSNSFRVPVSRPPAPTDVRASDPAQPSPRSTVVRWNDVANDTGALVRFNVRCTSADGGTTRAANTTGSRVTVAKLSRHKTYTCAVRATNSAGISAWTNADPITVG